MPAEEEVTLAAPNIHISQAYLAYNEKVVFADLSLDLPASKWVALLGPSGVGKSSFLRFIAGFMTSQEKSHGKIIADNGIPVQQQVAYMAQTDLLLPWLSVLDNATLGLKLRHYKKEEYTACIDSAKLLLEKVGLSKAIHLYPAQLSGGMRQRVALVRTLIENKPLVLMDEPFSALDAITRYRLQELTADLLKNKTVLFITHDPTEALRLADEIYILHGNPAQLKSVVSLTTAKPRKLNNTEIIQLQSLLFHELSQAVEEAA